MTDYNPYDNVFYELNSNWENEILYWDWIDISNKISIKSVLFIKSTTESLISGIYVDLPHNFLRIVLIYLIKHYTDDDIHKFYQFVSIKYSNKYLRNEITSITNDVNNNPQSEFDHLYKTNNWRKILPIQLIFRILIEQKKYTNKISDEKERILNKICIPSFNKYFDYYKNKYSYTYISPNKISSSSNYGFIIDSIKNNFNYHGILFDVSIPNCPHVSLFDLRKKEWEKNHLGQYFDNTYFLNKTDLSPKISKQIKDLITEETKDLFIELSIKNEIKRFFLRGGIDLQYLMFDYVYKYGFNYLQKHITPEKWIEFISFNTSQENLFQNKSKKWKFHLETLLQIDYPNKIEKNHFLFGYIDERLTSDNLIKYITNDFLPYIETTKLFELNIPLCDNIQVVDFISEKNLYYEYISSFSEPENEIRNIFGIPKIGEGWVSETKLFYLTKEKFNNHLVIQHGKPTWLGKQHLDIYLPELNIGIEYQGKQHSIPVEFFGGIDSFQENKKRDLKKKKLCKENGCTLYEVFPDDDFSIFIEKIYNLHGTD